ncbi:hypothetical protein T10_2484, partial [Trichinella papuae]
LYLTAAVVINVGKVKNAVRIVLQNQMTTSERFHS